MFKTKISPQLTEAIESKRYADSRAKAESTHEDLKGYYTVGDRVREELWKDNKAFEVKRAASLFANPRCLKFASKRIYIKWLEGYVASGGKIRHAYDHTFPGTMYVAKKDCTVTPLYGENTVEIIVPEHINVTIEELGHNTLYFMKDFKIEGGSASIYSDF